MSQKKIYANISNSEAEMERERIKKIMAKPMRPRTTGWYWKVKGTGADISKLIF